VKFLGQSAFLGTGSVVDLARESDPEVLLAVQAANVAAAEMLEEQHKRLAQHIISRLADALS
jgi:hypothetical protein